MTIKEENIPEPKEGEIIQNLMEGRLAKKGVNKKARKKRRKKKLYSEKVNKIRKK